MSNNAKLFRFSWIAIASVGLANTVVVPNVQLISAGNDKSDVPTSATSINYQELLGAGQFHSSPITITALSFRARPGAGPLNVAIGSLTVYLSTSPKSPNGAAATLMSATFADNIGKDKTLVFSGSNISVKSPGCAAPGPCPFDITIQLQTPFVYAPSAGPLLIDMTENNLVGTGSFDASSFSAPGGGVASVAALAGNPTGTFLYAGNVVQVTYGTTAPVVSGIVNVASSIPPGMPNYALAQGSLFAVYGTGLGAADLAIANLPLPTNGLAGTSITVGVNGVSTSAPIFFSRSDVVVGVMPSNAATGNGNMTIVYKGQSATMPITITQSGFGISNNVIPFASNGIGVASNAAVTFPDYKTVTATNTAKPGDTLTVWGTGLGATPNGGGDTNAPPAGNIGAAPQVFVGGIQSPSVSYWGRAPGLIPGLDQINFQVPLNAPLGCNISIVVQTANGATPIVSNAPTIALSDTDGGTCSDPNLVVPSSFLNAAETKIIVVDTRQSTDVTPNPNGTTTSSTTNHEAALFFKLTHDQLAAIARTNNIKPSFNTCYVGINADPDNGGPFDATPLNAGPSVTLTPPSGTPFNLSRQGVGDYSSQENNGSLPAGQWSFSSVGGPDVGPLNFNFTLPQPITWTNQTALTGSVIDRTKPLTITWTGNDSTSFVDIQGFGQSGAAITGIYSIGFECTAPVSAGQLVIPSSILLAMPPGFKNLTVSTSSFPGFLGNVPGFDAVVNSSNFHTSVPVNFR